jgi:hypothetical protein
MRAMVFVKAARESEKGSFLASWRTGMMAAPRAAPKAAIGAAPGATMARFAAKLVACAAPAPAQAAPYPTMAPADAYLMDRTEEIALARSAAPNSISKDATILVLTRTGYETAVTGSNGFVCWVGRGFVGAFDFPERWNPKIRGAECQNPQAARFVLPLSKLITSMVLAGRTTAETIDRIKIALSTKEIPPLESGAMSYMMSKSSYLTDAGEHDMPHLMFFVAVKDAADWGANASDTPVSGGNYWFFTPGHEPETAKLPLLSVFVTGVATWSDGTPAQAHRM